MHMTENKDIQPQKQASASYAHGRNKDIQPQQQASASYAHDRERRHTATTTGIC